MSGIALLKQELGRYETTHVLRAPRWVPPADAEGYWHIPRSAGVDPCAGARITFWCGISRRGVDLSHCTNDRPTGNLCGTCEGRANGYEGRDGLVFRPRDAFNAPRWCPALCHGATHCEYCGAKAKWRRSFCHYDETRHRPGDRLALLAPCPRHGWKYIKQTNAGLVCRDYHWCRDDMNCGYVVARRSTDGGDR